MLLTVTTCRKNFVKTLSDVNDALLRAVYVTIEFYCDGIHVKHI